MNHLQAVEEVLHVPLIAAGHIKLLIDGRNIQDYQLVNVDSVAERGHHDCSASHAVTSKTHPLQSQVLHQLTQVSGHERVVHI